MFDLSEAQQELADRLGIEKKEDVADMRCNVLFYVFENPANHGRTRRLPFRVVAFSKGV